MHSNTATAVRAAPTPHRLSDTALVGLARQGDGTAFEAIMRRNNRRLFRIARSILKDEAEAEDVVQETYVRAYLKLDQFAGQASLSTWLVRIAINEALMCRRKTAPWTGMDAMTEPLDDTGFEAETNGIGLWAGRAAQDSPEAGAARDEIRRVLEQAIDALPPAFRTVFVLRAVEEFSTADTAACLGIPAATVKTRFHRAKRLLREGLSQQLEAMLADTFPFAGSRCDRIVAGVLGRLDLTSRGVPDPEPNDTT